MGTDGVVHDSEEPFKQRVAGSIPARLIRKIAHLPSVPFLTRQMCTQGVYLNQFRRPWSARRGSGITVRSPVRSASV
jgi:hypothetical protein